MTITGSPPNATEVTQGGLEMLLPSRGRRRHSDYAWLTPSQQAVRDRIDSVRTALPGRHRSGAES